MDLNLKKFKKLDGPPFMAQCHRATWAALHSAFRWTVPDTAAILRITHEEVQALHSGDLVASLDLQARASELYGVKFFTAPFNAGDLPVWELTPRSLQILRAARYLKHSELAAATGLGESSIRDLTSGRVKDPRRVHRLALGLALGVEFFSR